MRDVFVTPRFKKDLKSIPLIIQREIDRQLPRLKQYPTDPVLDIKKLKGLNHAVWRMRIGSYRMLFSFNAKSITLLGICHRKDIYRNL